MLIRGERGKSDRAGKSNIPLKKTVLSIFWFQFTLRIIVTSSLFNKVNTLAVVINIESEM